MADEPIKSDQNNTPDPTPPVVPEPAPEPTLKDVMIGIGDISKRVTDLEGSKGTLSAEELEKLFQEEEPTPPSTLDKAGPIDYETASMKDIVQNVFDEVKTAYVDPLTTQVARLTAKVEFNELKDTYGDAFMNARQDVARLGMANPHLSMEQAYDIIRGKTPPTTPASATPPKANATPINTPTSPLVVPIGEKEGTAPGAVKLEGPKDLSEAADAAWNEVMGPQ